MKAITRAIVLCMVIVLALPMAALAAEDGYATSYTYTYDYWADIRESPDAYRVEQVLYSADLGLEVPMSKPQSLFVQGRDLYICDTGNNRILHTRRVGDRFALIRVIDAVKGAQPETFNTPSDVAVDAQGNLYVCDTNNNRVVMMDAQLNFVREFLKPSDSTFDQNLSFLPRRLAVDSSGRVFVLATNVNKGLVKFEADGTFTGFIGANPVTVNMWDYIWKTFFTTKAQRAQQESFVPTEYESVCIDRGQAHPPPQQHRQRYSGQERSLSAHRRSAVGGRKWRQGPQQVQGYYRAG